MIWFLVRSQYPLALLPLPHFAKVFCEHTRMRDMRCLFYLRQKQVKVVWSGRLFQQYCFHLQIPVVLKLSAHGIELKPLVWALAMGSCLGGKPQSRKKSSARQIWSIVNVMFHKTCHRKTFNLSIYRTRFAQVCRAPYWRTRGRGFKTQIGPTLAVWK